MSDFKGTKGKWYLQEYSDDYTNILRVETETHKNIFIGSTSQSTEGEQRYNAKLMSKAPEMLQMLEIIYQQVDFSFEAWGSDTGLKMEQSIKQLIKEATEL